MNIKQRMNLICGIIEISTGISKCDAFPILGTLLVILGIFFIMMINFVGDQKDK